MWAEVAPLFKCACASIKGWCFSTGISVPCIGAPAWKILDQLLQYIRSFQISKQTFNWTSMKNVVIGRPAYDNYFVGVARKNNVSIVDATKSILALHQTGSDGKFAGAKNKDSKYNRYSEFNYYRQY